MERERRRTPRYPFVASIEMREGKSEDKSEDKRTARVTGLSLNGCYVSTENPYPGGTSLAVKVFTETEFFEGLATVIYSQGNRGMGLMFTDTKPYYLMVLRKWLLSAMMAKKEKSR
jgi:PilZ domain-containing protein